MRRIDPIWWVLVAGICVCVPIFVAGFRERERRQAADTQLSAGINRLTARTVDESWKLAKLRADNENLKRLVAMRQEKLHNELKPRPSPSPRPPAIDCMIACRNGPLDYKTCMDECLRHDAARPKPPAIDCMEKCRTAPDPEACVAACLENEV